MEQTVYIVLENGTVFEGKNFGAPIDSVTGEMVFTTSMTGYLETLSDPSYWGQIVVQTFPLIGNYGVIPSDFESSVLWPSAYIVREWCQSPSNFRSEGDLDTFFKEKGFPAVYGVDTRSLTRILREHGAMNGWITAKAPPYSQTELFAMKSYAVKEAVPHVTVSEPKSFPAQGAELHNVVLWDFGSKNNIRRELCRRGCRVTVLPASSQAEDILSFSPDGVMLSNGPGDPAENTDIIRELQKLCGSYFRHLPGPPAPCPCQRRQDGKAEIRPQRRKSTCEGCCHRQGLYHQSEPWLRCIILFPAGWDPHQFLQSERRHLRGPGI